MLNFERGFGWLSHKRRWSEAATSGKLSLGGAKQVWSDVESKGCRYLSRSGEPPQWECGVWRPPAMQYYHCLSLILPIWTKCTVMCDFNSLYCHNKAKFANRVVTWSKARYYWTYHVFSNHNYTYVFLYKRVRVPLRRGSYLPHHFTPGESQ